MMSYKYIKSNSTQEIHFDSSIYLTVNILQINKNQ